MKKILLILFFIFMLEFRKTVMSFVSDITKERVYPVGRLDRNTTGLLILTNDGTAGRTVAFSGGTFKYPDGSVTRTTTANATDIWFFMTPDGGTTYYVSIPMKNLS